MNKNETDILNTFLEFEAKENLFEKKILGVYFWHLIRFVLYKKLINYHFDIGNAHTSIKECHINAISRYSGSHQSILC